jgi:hypothetical protein
MRVTSYYSPVRSWVADESMTSRVGEAEVGEMVADFVVGQRLQQEQKFIRDRGHAVPFEKRTERKRARLLAP